MAENIVQKICKMAEKDDHAAPATYKTTTITLVGICAVGLLIEPLLRATVFRMSSGETGAALIRSNPLSLA